MHHGLKYKIIKLLENIYWKYILYDFSFIPFVEVYLMNQDMVYFGDCSRAFEQNCIFCCCWVNCFMYVGQISLVYCVVHIFYILLIFHLIGLTAAKSSMYIPKYNYRFVYGFTYFEALLFAQQIFRLLCVHGELNFLSLCYICLYLQCLYYEICLI